MSEKHDAIDAAQAEKVLTWVQLELPGIEKRAEKRAEGVYRLVVRIDKGYTSTRAAEALKTPHSEN